MSAKKKTNITLLGFTRIYSVPDDEEEESLLSKCNANNPYLMFLINKEGKYTGAQHLLVVGNIYRDKGPDKEIFYVVEEDVSTARRHVSTKDYYIQVCPLRDLVKMLVADPPNKSAYPRLTMLVKATCDMDIVPGWGTTLPDWLKLLTANFNRNQQYNTKSYLMGSHVEK